MITLLPTSSPSALAVFTVLMDTAPRKRPKMGSMIILLATYCRLFIVIGPKPLIEFTLEAVNVRLLIKYMPGPLKGPLRVTLPPLAKVPYADEMVTACCTVRMLPMNTVAMMPCNARIDNDPPTSKPAVELSESVVIVAGDAVDDVAVSFVQMSRLRPTTESDVTYICVMAPPALETPVATTEKSVATVMLSKGMELMLTVPIEPPEATTATALTLLR